MAMRIAITARRDDVARVVGSALAAGQQVLGGRLQPADSRAFQPVPVGKQVGAVFPHRLAAVEAQPLLGTDLAAAYSGKWSHGVLVLTK